MGGNVVELEGRGDEALIVTVLAILIFQINIGYVLGLVLLGGDTLTLAQPRDRHDHLRTLWKPGKKIWPRVVASFRAARGRFD